jgi:hypothetical protein
LYRHPRSCAPGLEALPVIIPAQRKAVAARFIEFFTASVVQSNL